MTIFILLPLIIDSKYIHIGSKTQAYVNKYKDNFEDKNP